MAKRLDRLEPRARWSWWGFVWAFPILLVFREVGRAYPGSGSRWLDALFWTVFGVAFALCVLRAERTLLRIGWPVAGRGSWGLTRPIGWITWATLFGVLAQFINFGAAAAVAYVAVVAFDHFLAGRQDLRDARSRRASDTAPPRRVVPT